MAFEAIKIQKSKTGQAIRIPDSFQIDDDKVYLKKVGNMIYVIPFHSPWDGMIESLSGFTPDFMSEREQPKDQNREPLD